MADIITTQQEIPDARFYVVAHDTFMSGWGPAADKDNYLILPCNTRMEAQVVEENTRNRDEMRDIMVLDVKPDMDGLAKAGRDILWQVMDRQGATRWYTPGGFS
tara:strand:+ start:55 stop:366 length:312 start_codon:yes stop_codon:yes gene_type:complete